MRQRQEAALAARLRATADSRSYVSDGFRSLDAWARERLGLTTRRVYYLLALHRTLASLRRLRDAFLRGRLTMRQVLLVGSVATPATEGPWIERAGGTTLRRLDDEVTYWLHLKETRPDVWKILAGRPLPRDLVLIPGQSPRLREHLADEGAGFPTPSDLHESAPSAPLRPNPGLHGSAPNAPLQSDPPINAEAFLDALNADEEAVPLPARTCRITMRVDPQVQEGWNEICRVYRSTLRNDMADWDVLSVLLYGYWKTWDNEETDQQRRRHPTLERDGWRCTAPGCSSLGTGQLHEHHIRYRSAGGPLREPANLTTLCTGHHLGLLHNGLIRCGGRAPDSLRWKLGLERGKAAFLSYQGEERTGGIAV
jgi:hypothetical protein